MLMLISEHKEWIFSGIGLFILSSITYIFKKIINQINKKIVCHHIFKFQATMRADIFKEDDQDFIIGIVHKIPLTIFNSSGMDLVVKEMEIDFGKYNTSGKSFVWGTNQEIKLHKDTLGLFSAGHLTGKASYGEKINIEDPNNLHTGIEFELPIQLVENQSINAIFTFHLRFRKNAITKTPITDSNDSIEFIEHCFPFIYGLKGASDGKAYGQPRKKGILRLNTNKGIFSNIIDFQLMFPGTVIKIPGHVSKTGSDLFIKIPFSNS